MSPAPRLRAGEELPRLNADPQLGRFWAHRGEDGVNREKQLLIDFLCASAGGPVYYRGRDMTLTHRGFTRRGVPAIAMPATAVVSAHEVSTQRPLEPSRPLVGAFTNSPG